MSNDEQAIRNLVAVWMEATSAGDIHRIRGLMSENVVFLTPGNPPMKGREAFVAAFEAGLPHVRIDAKSEIQEVQVVGEMAWMWSHLTVTVTPRQGGEPMRRVGFTLTIFRKQADGSWTLIRDANMLTAASSSTT